MLLVERSLRRSADVERLGEANRGVVLHNEGPGDHKEASGVDVAHKTASASVDEQHQGPIAG